MTGVLNEMRQTNRLITKEAVFHYFEQKTRSAFSVLLSLPPHLGLKIGAGFTFSMLEAPFYLRMLMFLAKCEVS